MRSETLSDNPVARCSRWEGLARHVGQLSRTLPKSIVCDDAPELTSKATFFWAKRAGVKLHFVQPGNQTSVPSSNPSKVACYAQLPASNVARVQEYGQ
jgi:hypothetical protein